MGDSAPSHQHRTRSGGRAQPPATPARRRKKVESERLGSEQINGQDKTLRTKLRSSRRIGHHEVPSSSGCKAQEDEESPTKRQKHDASTSGIEKKRAASSGNGKKQAPKRNLFAADAIENLSMAQDPITDVCEASEYSMLDAEPLHTEQLNRAWSDLHQSQLSHRTLTSDPYAKLSEAKLNDQICLICHGSGDNLVPCMLCLHAVCPNCVDVQTDNCSHWSCPSIGLRCTKRRQIRTESSASSIDVSQFKSKSVIRLKSGDFVEVPSYWTPGIIQSRSWLPGYDSSDDRLDDCHHSFYYALVTDVKNRSKDVQVEFLVYADQLGLSNLSSKDLLLTTTPYTLQRYAISRRTSIPIFLGAQPPASLKGDHFVVRSRYDLARRICRPLLQTPESTPADILRSRPSITTSLSQIEQAVQSLQLSSAPDVLPCRDKERSQIERLLISQIRVGGGSGGALYISGLPGTGKTATVRRVVHGLKQNPKLQEFQYVEINALKLQAPRCAYTELWKAISGHHVAPMRALALLKDYFDSNTRSRRRRPIIILVLDEFDYLVERKTHNVIYNLFSFPTAPKSGLIVVGIANTLDLPERIGGRVFSRLGLQCMNFEPYTAAQIEEIILERLKGLHERIIDQNAVRLCSKSIASTSGDLRRALEIMSTAIELCSKDRGRLTMSHITLARSQFSDTPAIQYIRGAAVQELAIVCALLLELKQVGRDEVSYDSVIRRSGRILAMRGLQLAPSPVTDRILFDLSNRGLIVLCLKRDFSRPNLRLYACIDDVKHALEKTAFNGIV